MMGLFGKKKGKPADGDGAARPPFQIEAGVQTDVGCVREANEDSGRYTRPSDAEHLRSKGILAVVCDGMGGHACGEVASQMAIEVINRSYYEDAAPPTEALKRAIEAANAQVHAASLRDANLQGMGTTCVALVLHDGQAFAAHVGDSRLYMLREGDLYQMTEDHSAVVEMVKHGIISADEARTHEDKNVILRALGTGPEVEVETWEHPMSVREDDRFLLCSDGLSDMVEDEEIRRTLLASADVHDACARLIEQARAGGGHDNITVGVVHIQPAGRAGRQEVRATREVEVAR
jgi:PPM family protein phosphatase